MINSSQRFTMCLLFLLGFALSFSYLGYTTLVENEEDLLYAVNEIQNSQTRKDAILSTLDSLLVKQLTHEDDIMDLITESRLAGNLSTLVENYPELTSSTSFLVLQEQYESNENHLFVARQRYNKEKKIYSKAIRKPHNKLLMRVFDIQDISK